MSVEGPVTPELERAAKKAESRRGFRISLPAYIYLVFFFAAVFLADFFAAFLVALRAVDFFAVFLADFFAVRAVVVFRDEPAAA